MSTPTVPIPSPTAHIGSTSPYNYVPTLYVCVIFVVFFSLSTIAHLGQAIRSRIWWLLPTAVLCGIGEILGWSGRLWSSQNPTLFTPFLIQISTTIIAPTFLSAANFIILGQVIRQLGVQYSRFSPRTYGIVFITADVIALIVQAIGGGSASTAAQNHRNAETGGHIMLGGIIIQMVAITIYTLLAAEFVVRYSLDRPRTKGSAVSRPQSPSDTIAEGKGRAPMSSKMKMMLLGLGISTLFLFIRAVYRTVELVDGWTGRIISTQSYFNWLDGMPICVAMFSLNIFHPGRLIDQNNNREADMEKASP